MISCFNGQLIEEQSISISIDDRAFQYGDGIFETIIVRSNKIFFIHDHWMRLLKGCKVLKLNLPEYFNLEYLKNLIDQVISQNNLSDARIKLILWRKTGGFYTPTALEINFVLMAKSLTSPVISTKSVIKVCKTTKLVLSELSSIKTLNALPYILAGLEKLEISCDDLLLLNYQSQICELISANIFFIKGRSFVTPNLESGILEGVMRKQVINIASQIGYTIQEASMDIKSLNSFEGAFSTNVTGFSIINQIENSHFSSATTKEVLHKLVNSLELK